MDSATKSAAAVARELGTTIPRVVRAVDRLGLRAARAGGSNRLALTQEMVGQVADELGMVPSLPGLSRIEVRALAALGEAPFGVASARTLARRAGISPTSASKALQRLCEKGLVDKQSMVIASGRAKRANVWSANRLASDWSRLAPELGNVHFPDHATQADEEVPARLRHLFWNTAAAQLKVARYGAYIARRLIATMDLEGLAWGARNLQREDWLSAAEARNLDDRTRALAKNLAAQADGPR
jgi:DNA-binding Lrp family transcriptional regulator